jgi:hypothetical protein
VKRIVTGLDDRGNSTVVSVDQINDVDVWEADLSATPPWVTGRGKLMGFEPDTGKVKVMSVTFSPGEGAAADSGAASGLHKTRSIDVILVREPLILILESGEVSLDGGDVVVQQGTMHDWRNPGDEPARLFGFSWGIAGPEEPEAGSHGA